MGKGGQGRQGGENQDVHLGRNWRTKALIGGGEGTVDMLPGAPGQESPGDHSTEDKEWRQKVVGQTDRSQIT